ncbi:type VII secretion-associated serine protease mycosin [Streptomyces sp. TRM75563]|uniref:type VII secretion-associated serine protease mycosin n=1 Tax=Streptomyces sp. TRM75563 TaxID=2817418 RepID=UPI001F60D467|nr:type VII secretion-associated serine protease mycosin [Streptomyces sp. TRM75563]MCI4045046.1 type VII secretion-associated serine protease mycosin [Streptomyces sp. TRM75563]
MPTGSRRRIHVRVVLASLVGLLVGIAAPAHADSMRSKQWHLDVMKADEMWASSTGEGVTVAVIDTGVDDSNPDLRGRVLKGKDLAERTSGDEHTDTDGHGTGMAGLIAGTGARDGGRGAFGLAPGANILPIRLTRSEKSKNQAEGLKTFNRSVPAAIRFAADSGAKVINISLAVERGSQNLDESVEYALNKGSLIFAGVGNGAKEGNKVMFPAATPGVVGVGAVGQDLARSEFSHYGSQVDLAAPGEEMVHACGGGTGLCESYGTSTATALVSASAALIWSKHSDLTNNQVLRVMLNTAGGPVSGKKRSDGIGYGIVRPRIALKTPGDPGPADVYPLPDLAAAASEAPSPQPSKAGGGSDQSEEPAAAAADEGSDTALWLGLGIGAAVLVGGGVTAAVLRSRRRKALAAQAPSAYQPPYGYGQPQFQPPYPPASPPPGAPENTSH